MGAGFCGLYSASDAYLHTESGQMVWCEMFAVLAALTTYATYLRDSSVLFILVIQPASSPSSAYRALTSTWPAASASATSSPRDSGLALTIAYRKTSDAPAVMAMAWGNDELCPLRTFFHNRAFLDWLDLPRSPSDALFVHRFQGHAHLPSRPMTISHVYRARPRAPVAFIASSCATLAPPDRLMLGWHKTSV